MNKSLKKIGCILLVFMMLLPAGCSTEQKADYDKTVVDKFTTALKQQNFAEAHDYFWKHAAYENKETFVAECEYIINALEVSEIRIENVQVTESDGEFILSYTCLLNSASAGEIRSDVSTHIVLQEKSSYVEYSHELLLKDFIHGCTIIKSPLEGKRGEILTSDGKIIAENNYADTVCISVSDSLNITSLLADVDAILSLTDKELSKAKKSFESAVENNYSTSVIKAYTHNSIDPALEEQLTAIEGVYVDRSSITPQRYYPYENIYFHVVGYTGSPNEEQTEHIAGEGYSPSSVYGKEGLESAYNEMLMSKDGYRITIRGENGTVLRTLCEVPQQNGTTLETTLDSTLQETSYYALVSHLTDRQTGVVISLDPTTGAVKSMVSYPSVNANIFSTSISDAEYEKLTDEENGLPLFNRATLGLYPPGSVIKPFIGGYAMDEKIVSVNTQFPYEISGNKWIPENWHWPPITRDSNSGTPLVMKNALSHSDNIYFSWLGLQLGSAKLMTYLEWIGFGQKQAFDLPTTTSNLKYKDTEMTPVLLTDMSIGHGEMLCTPIQIAALYTAFSNEGDILTPYLTENSERTVQRENIFSIEAMNGLLPGLREAAISGTARAANIKDMKLYAKTGTAIKRENTDARISWICIWGEHNGESLLTLVMIDGPAAEDSVKNTIAKTVMQTFRDQTEG